MHARGIASYVCIGRLYIAIQLYVRSYALKRSGMQYYKLLSVFITTISACTQSYSPLA